jgi:hypothetical protein
VVLRTKSKPVAPAKTNPIGRFANLEIDSDSEDEPVVIKTVIKKKRDWADDESDDDCGPALPGTAPWAK